MTAVRSRVQQRGFTLLELAVSVLVVAALAGTLLIRVQQYQGEVERQTVQQTIGTLREAMVVRLAKGGGDHRPARLARIAEENPFDWLVRKPENYLGEYYSPELEKMPEGNWVFDRRDKTLIYLLNSHKSFSFDASILLRFKVEFAQARMPGVKHGPAEVPNGLVIVQLNDQSAGSDEWK